MTTRRPLSTSANGKSALSGPMAGGQWSMAELTSGPFVGMGRQGGICRKRTSPIKCSYFYETEEVLEKSVLKGVAKNHSPRQKKNTF